MLEGMALKAKLHLHSIIKMILDIWLERERFLKEKKMEGKILCKFHDEKKFIYSLSQIIMNQGYYLSDTHVQVRLLPPSFFQNF